MSSALTLNKKVVSAHKGTNCINDWRKQVSSFQIFIVILSIVIEKLQKFKHGFVCQIIRIFLSFSYINESVFKIVVIFILCKCNILQHYLILFFEVITFTNVQYCFIQRFKHQNELIIKVFPLPKIIL